MIWLVFIVLILVVASASPVTPHRQAFSLDTVSNPRWSRNGPAEYVAAYRKFGVDLPDLGSDKSSTGSISAVNQSYDREYLSPVQFGNPGQTLMMDLDTGSSDVWVYSSETAPYMPSSGRHIYHPENSSTAAKMRNGTWYISYGDGSYARGYVYTDTISIANVTVKNATVESAKYVSEDMSTGDDVISGIFGLCRNHSTTVYPQRPTVLEEMNKLLPDGVFGVDLKYQETGQYNFGFINESAYKESIVWKDVLPNTRFWMVTMDALHVGGTNVWYHHSWPVVVDTGTTLMLLPEEIAALYWAEVPSARIHPYFGGWTYACNETLPPFDIGFNTDGGIQRTRIPGEYMNFQNVTDTECYGGIQQAFPGMTFSILGDVFLKSVYAIFDTDNNRVGFANKDGYLLS